MTERRGGEDMSATGSGAIPASWATAAETGTYEDALGTLDEIVAFLEDGRRPLDQMVAAYEAGVRISQRCEELLATAELRVSQIAVEQSPRGISWLDRDDDSAADQPEGEDDDAVHPDEAPF
jgi:exodeoxyribonuclease VII small subunit